MNHLQTLVGLLDDVGDRSMFASFSNLDSIWMASEGLIGNSRFVEDDIG